MAQNVTVAGAQYSDVPAVDLPKTGGGTARFVDTSDANALAGDIQSGKTAYVNGTRLTGTGQSGGAAVVVLTTTIDASAFADAMAGSPTGFFASLESGSFAAAKAAVQSGSPAVLLIALDNNGTETGQLSLPLVYCSGSHLHASPYLNSDPAGVWADVNQNGQINIEVAGTRELPDVTAADNGKVLRVQNGGWRKADESVFWVNGQLDMQTMTVSALTQTREQIVAAWQADRIVKIRLSYAFGENQTATAVGDMRVLTSDGTVVFNVIMRGEIGGSSQLLCVSLYLYSSGGSGVALDIINRTASSGG